VRRRTITPRENWQATVESQGFHFHTLDEQPYWDESVCYALSNEEVDALEKATYALDAMCLEAVEYVLGQPVLERFQIPLQYHDWLRRSWEEDEHTIYGRFDFAFPPSGPPRLLEYNADTPTALLEAAVVQWFWLKDTRLGGDQFNSIHERLIEAWGAIAADGPVHFASLRDNLEDFMTVNYLRDTAMQAGLKTEFLAVEDIAWASSRHQFVDRRDQAIGTIFKLYPWEWMLREEFGPHLLESRTRWFEPPWKMILSNKAILPVLWHLFPTSPYLLRADYQPLGRTYVQKPIYGREGANITLVRDGHPVFESEGPYEGPYIFQEACPLPEFDGNYPVVGSWMVNGYACGIGIREDTQAVTQNTSRFVPHYIDRRFPRPGK
jgi:glutathionylspermidine synthase